MENIAKTLSSKRDEWEAHAAARLNEDMNEYDSCLLRLSQATGD